MQILHHRNHKLALAARLEKAQVAISIIKMKTRANKGKSI
jgi:hypothetical protein